MTKNNVKANIWKLYMIFEANKEFMENLSLHRGVVQGGADEVGTGSFVSVDFLIHPEQYGNACMTVLIRRVTCESLFSFWGQRKVLSCKIYLRGLRFINRVVNQNHKSYQTPKPTIIDPRLFYQKMKIIQDWNSTPILIHAVRKSRDIFVTNSYTPCIYSQSDTDEK